MINDFTPLCSIQTLSTYFKPKTCPVPTYYQVISKYQCSLWLLPSKRYGAVDRTRERNGKGTINLLRGPVSINSLSPSPARKMVPPSEGRGSNQCVKPKEYRPLQGYTRVRVDRCLAVLTFISSLNDEEQERELRL